MEKDRGDKNSKEITNQRQIDGEGRGERKENRTKIEM
jgi:hypothetical protein